MSYQPVKSKDELDMGEHVAVPVRDTDFKEMQKVTKSILLRTADGYIPVKIIDTGPKSILLYLVDEKYKPICMPNIEIAVDVFGKNREIFTQPCKNFVGGVT